VNSPKRHSQDRKWGRSVALASIALGIYCLLAVPVFYVIFADTVRLLGGESPGSVLLALGVAPLLIRSGGVKALLAPTLLSAFVIRSRHFWHSSCQVSA